MSNEVSKLILKIGLEKFLEDTILFLEPLEQDERVSELKDTLAVALNNYTFSYEPEHLLHENEELKRKLDRADTDFVALSEHHEQLVNK